jgi:hypothetical protein
MKKLAATTPDELRELADALDEAMFKLLAAKRTEEAASCDRAGAYLSACADAQPVAWMYEHDGCADTPLFTVNRWTKCEEPWNESPLFLHPAPAAPQAEPKHELTADERDMIGSALRSSVRLAARRGWRAEAKPASGDDLNVYREIADGYRNDAQVEPKREDQPLRDLLAVIHCDGGHHTEAVGIEQSIKDALTAVCVLKGKLAEAAMSDMTQATLALAEFAAKEQK